MYKDLRGKKNTGNTASNKIPGNGDCRDRTYRLDILA